MFNVSTAIPRLITHPCCSASQQFPTSPGAPTRKQTLQSLRRIYTSLDRIQHEFQ